jgi:hypothetical protein
MGLIKLLVFGLAALTVIYFSISLYSRSVRREKLEKRWDGENPGSDDKAARDAYIEEGMIRYESGFRKKLIFLVYIVPIVVVTTILYVTNAN